MTLKNLLPYLRYTIRSAKTVSDLRAAVELLGYGGVTFDKPFTPETFVKAKQELLEEFDFLVADQECIYTK